MPTEQKRTSDVRALDSAELELASGGGQNAKYQVILDAPQDMDNANAMMKKFCNDDGNAAMFISQHFGLDLAAVHYSMKGMSKQNPR